MDISLKKTIDNILNIIIISIYKMKIISLNIRFILNLIRLKIIYDII